MKIIRALAFFLVIISASCSQNLHKAATTDASGGETSGVSGKTDSLKGLRTTMVILPRVGLNEAVNLRFTVYNDSDSAKVFCKWHTPFERLMSKYLDITDESGEEVQYTGPMAKRVMPPPASSYISLAAGDSLAATINLQEAYLINKPSKYIIRYNSAEISGLSIENPVSFIVGK